ncbi:MAG: group II intron maturase-specific domain-containing protein [Clostridium sp.]|uniref:group II intron maturase-specific domain-containing protein n=1 Tax=Clostridium sp. TaxID=1506 RepID=UPI0039E7F8D5
MNLLLYILLSYICIHGNRSNLKMDMYELVQIVNKKLIGLKNYYNLKYAKEHLNSIDWYATEKFTIWYNHKKQR